MWWFKHFHWIGSEVKSSSKSGIWLVWLLLHLHLFLITLVTFQAIFERLKALQEQENLRDYSATDEGPSHEDVQFSGLPDICSRIRSYSHNHPMLWSIVSQLSGITKWVAHSNTFISSTLGGTCMVVWLEHLNTVAQNRKQGAVKLQKQGFASERMLQTNRHLWNTVSGRNA